MKKIKKGIALSLILAISMMMVACGGGGGGEYNSAIDSFGASMESGSYYDSDYKYQDIKEPLVPEETNQPDVNADRKIIYTASLSIESKEYDKTITLIEESILKHGGYIASNYSYGNPEEGARGASYSVRIPVENYKAFMEDASGAGNLVNKRETAEDITTKFVDTEARLEVKKAEKARLEELMKRAETMEDILTLDARISEIQGDIEGYTAQLKSMQNRVSFCTIDIDVDEVIIYTPTDTLFSTELITAFVSGFTDFVEFIQDIILFVVYNMFFFAFFIPLIIIGVKHYKKGQKKRREKLSKDLKEKHNKEIEEFFKEDEEIKEFFKDEK